MSILIKGMTMPTECYNCCLRYFDGEDDVCAFGGEIMHGEERRDECPLVFVPPHGDLIDRDMVLKKSWDMETFVDAVRNAPAVIEAEEDNG